MRALLVAVLAASAAPGPIAPATPAGGFDESAELIPGVIPGPPPSPEELEARATALGKTLRCPVCQGSNIKDSVSSTAKAMYERMRQLMAAGYSDEQIVDYFVDKYGEFILLDPQESGANIFLFLGPGLGFGLGLALALKAMAGFRKEPGASPVAAVTPEQTEELDDFERRLLAELNDD